MVEIMIVAGECQWLMYIFWVKCLFVYVLGPDHLCVYDFWRSEHLCIYSIGASVPM
jgi:hypothetical protein